MEIKEILSRIGYVRNKANLSAREVSQRIGMSPQYVAQLESGRIVLTVEKLLQILEICEFPIGRFFQFKHSWLQDWQRIKIFNRVFTNRQKEKHNWIY